MRVLVTGFHGGEFSPLLRGRFDLEAIRTGCQLCRNMIPRSLGGAFQRPGLLFAGKAHQHSGKTRLIPFAFSSSVVYRIELGSGYARFWLGNSLCLTQPGAVGAISAEGAPLVVPMPYGEDQIFDVQVAQANDVVWLCHPAYWPRRLIRYGEQDWRVDELPVTYPPMRDPNAKDITITVTGTPASPPDTGAPALPTDTAVSLVASADVFAAGDVGGYYEINHRRDLPFSDNTLTSFTGTPINVTGRWEVFTYGKWNGTLYLEEQRGATWQVLRSWKSVNDTNVQSNGEVDGDKRLRLRYVGTQTSIDGVAARAQLAPLDATMHGLVKITAVTDAQHATGTVVRSVWSTAATFLWAEGAWSERRGYPRAVTLHEQRIVWGGTKSQPQSVWGCAVSAFDDYQRTSLEDSAFTYQVAAQQSNPIVSLASQRGLYILTEGDEWLMEGTRDSPTITASKVYAERRSGHGSASNQAILAGGALVFVLHGGTILGEYLFDQGSNTFEAVDLTELAEHFGDEGFVQLAYAQNPHSIIWAVTKSGSLLSLSYKRRSGVLAWAKHTTAGGLFESVCVTPGATGVHEVWVTVRREFAGEVIRTVERFDPAHWAKTKADTRGTLCLADSAVVGDFASEVSELPGLDHLEGQTVGVLVDGAVHPDALVVDGKINLTRPGKQIVAGIKMEVLLQPFPIEVQLETGSTVGRRVRVAEADVKLWQSGAVEWADAPDSNYYPLEMRQVTTPTGQGQPLSTVQVKLPVAAKWRPETAIILRNRSMLPLNVLSMVLSLSHHGE